MDEKPDWSVEVPPKILTSKLLPGTIYSAAEVEDIENISGLGNRTFTKRYPDYGVSYIHVADV